MSKNKVGRELIADIIKSVIENRDDVEVDELFMSKLISNTMMSTPVVDILSSMDADFLPNGSEKDDQRLVPCIEVLALINSIIDHQLSENCPN
jgi:hypothetical protein